MLERKLLQRHCTLIKFIVLFALLLLNFPLAHAQMALPRLLTDVEREQYAPNGRGILDDAGQAQFTQDFLLANADYLVTEAEYLRGTRSSDRANLLLVRAPVIADAKELLARLRGTITITDDQMLTVCEQNPTNLLAELIKVVDEKSEEDDCRNIPLQPGQSKKFNHRSRLQIPAYHVMKRVSDTSYEAVLNLNVTDPANPSNGPATLEKIRGCMALVQPYLKGPDGKSLTITALSSEQAAALPEDQRPQQVNISIAPDTETRGNATFYRNSWGCETITHEILHLLGLCDEYHENGVFVAEWSCRIVPAGETQMGNHFEFFPKVIPRVTRCSCDNDICRRTTELRPDLLEGYAQMGNPCSTCNGKLLDTTFRPGATPGVTYANNVVTYVSKTTMRNLLTDVHFAKIISGYCAREAPGYAVCSQFSQISNEDPRCRQIPPQCSDAEYYRGTAY